MDEPQLTSEISEVDPVAEKNDINDILHSGFEIDKPMDADDKPMDVDDFHAGTSSNIKTNDLAEDMIGDEPGLDKDVSMTSDNQDVSIEQVEFRSPSHELDVAALDVTAQSEIVDLDFTEASVNISQLDVENHDDDSNDAFNALKQSETDALQEPKEEQEEAKEEDKSIEDKSDEPALEASEITEDEPSASAGTQMETDDLPGDTLEPEVNEIETETEATDAVETEVSQEDRGGEAIEVDEIIEGKIPTDFTFSLIK